MKAKPKTSSTAKSTWAGGIKPDGTFTKSDEEYVKAWRTLGAKVESVMPGWRVCGYDPGIYVRNPDKRRTLDIDIEVAKVLAEYYDTRGR